MSINVNIKTAAAMAIAAGLTMAGLTVASAQGNKSNIVYPHAVATMKGYDATPNYTLRGPKRIEMRDVHVTCQPGYVWVPRYRRCIYRVK